MDVTSTALQTAFGPVVTCQLDRASAFATPNPASWRAAIGPTATGLEWGPMSVTRKLRNWSRRLSPMRASISF